MSSTAMPSLCCIDGTNAVNCPSFLYKVIYPLFAKTPFNGELLSELALKAVMMIIHLTYKCTMMWVTVDFDMLINLVDGDCVL